MRSLKNLKNRGKPLFDTNNTPIPLFDTNNTPNLTLTPINHINSVLRMIGLPSSPIGLTEGGVWRDENGFLRIV